MARYTVSISREAWEDFEVDADNEQEAREKALEAASNYGDWNRADADYEVYDCVKG